MSQRGLFESATRGDSEEERLGNEVFESPTARRAHFLENLSQHLGSTTPSAGGDDRTDADRLERILRLSDPPYYTACKNIFLPLAFEASAGPGRTSPDRPFAGDFHVKNRHPVSRFHWYHTKVPPNVIKTLIEYYTEPGQIVLDIFAGTGMTGVAAREVGRRSILIDLSPAATFISSINCNSHDVPKVLKAIERILAESEAAFGSLYETKQHGLRVPVNYFVTEPLQFRG